MPQPRVGFSRAGKVLLLLVAWFGAPGRAHSQDLERELPSIHDIEFIGNPTFDRETLREQMLLEFGSFLHPLRKPRYQRNAFSKELRRLEAFYHRQGFGGVSARLDTVIVVDPRHGDVDLRIRIREGPRTKLREVRYTPQEVLSLQELRKATPIAPSDPYPFSAAQRGRLTQALRFAFLGRGHLAAVVRDSTILAADSTEAVLIFAVDPGPQFRVRSVTISGNQATDPAFIRRELRARPGDVYSYPRLQESQQNLYNTSLFRRVTLKEESIDIEKRTVDIAVRVEERKMTFVEGSVGIGKRDDYEAHVSGRGGHRNLFGRGHIIDLQSTIAYNLELLGDNYYLDVRLRYVNPHLFGSPVRFDPQVAYSFDKRIDAQLERIRIDVPFSLRKGRYWAFSVGPFASLTTTTLEEATDDLLGTRAIQAAVTRNSSSDLFDPHQGNVATFSAQRAGFGGDNYFTRLAGAYRRYIPLGNSVLALGLRTGWVESYGPSRESGADIGIEGVPFEFLYQAGGGSTVRGFDNNSLGRLLTTTTFETNEGTTTATVDTTEVHAGTVLLIGNMELRMPLPWLGRFKLGSVVFVDAGNVWNNVREMVDARFGPRYGEGYEGLADMRYSYGVGLRYATPFGPLRVDLGFPLKSFGRRRFHFGLGHTF